MSRIEPAAESHITCSAHPSDCFPSMGLSDSPDYHVHASIISVSFHHPEREVGRSSIHIQKERSRDCEQQNLHMQSVLYKNDDPKTMGFHPSLPIKTPSPSPSTPLHYNDQQLNNTRDLHIAEPELLAPHPTRLALLAFPLPTLLPSPHAPARPIPLLHDSHMARRRARAALHPVLGLVPLLEGAVVAFEFGVAEGEDVPRPDLVVLHGGRIGEVGVDEGAVGADADGEERILAGGPLDELQGEVFWPTLADSSVFLRRRRASSAATGGKLTGGLGYGSTKLTPVCFELILSEPGRRGLVPLLQRAIAWVLGIVLRRDDRLTVIHVQHVHIFTNDVQSISVGQYWRKWIWVRPPHTFRSEVYLTGDLAQLVARRPTSIHTLPAHARLPTHVETLSHRCGGGGGLSILFLLTGALGAAGRLEVSGPGISSAELSSTSSFSVEGSGGMGGADIGTAPGTGGGGARAAAAGSLADGGAGGGARGASTLGLPGGGGGTALGCDGAAAAGAGPGVDTGVPSSPVVVLSSRLPSLACPLFSASLCLAEEAMSKDPCLVYSEEQVLHQVGAAEAAWGSLRKDSEAVSQGSEGSLAVHDLEQAVHLPSGWEAESLDRVYRWRNVDLACSSHRPFDSQVLATLAVAVTPFQPAEAEEQVCFQLVVGEGSVSSCLRAAVVEHRALRMHQAEVGQGGLLAFYDWLEEPNTADADRTQLRPNVQHASIAVLLKKAVGSSPPPQDNRF
ncbi:hypothetical protein KC338_g247 [Hortaea werneckii]|nr:hypothetical protein KC338_g247 [Hortaea werneckii]